MDSGVVGWVHAANDTPQSVSSNRSQSCVLNFAAIMYRSVLFYEIESPLLNIDPFIYIVQIFVCKETVKNFNIFCVHKAVKLCRCSHF